MHYLACSTEVALQRLERREKTILRHTPAALVFERQEILQVLLPLYRQALDDFVDVNAV